MCVCACVSVCVCVCVCNDCRKGASVSIIAVFSGSSNYGYLEKHINRRRTWARRVHIFKNTYLGLFLHLRRGNEFMFGLVVSRLPVLLRPLFVTNPTEPHWQHLLHTNMQGLLQREHIEMDGRRENDRQQAYSLLCLRAVCETRPSAHSLSQP